MSARAEWIVHGRHGEHLAARSARKGASMQIKVKRPDVQASPPKHEPLPAPTLPEQESGAEERVYEDRQDAAFDPKGDRAPAGDRDKPASEESQR